MATLFRVFIDCPSYSWNKFKNLEKSDKKLIRVVSALGHLGVSRFGQCLGGSFCLSR